MFEQIIAPENIFAAWREFQRGKMKKADVLAFAERAEEHLLALAIELSALRLRDAACDRGDPVFHCSGLPRPAETGLAMTGKRNVYAHGKYIRFVVCDPKRREIAKASVRDRVLHHSVHRVLAPLLDRSFIFDSYSSRKGKGTHAAGKRFRQFAWTLSRNHTKTVWVLQLDMRRFFDSVDHEVLLGLLREKLSKFSVCHSRARPQRYAQRFGQEGGNPERKDWISGQARDDRNNDGDNEMDVEKLSILLGIVIRSFETAPGKGIPLGNLTSQLFSNVYLDPLDQFAKRSMRVKHYLRYADDIAILSRDREYLEDCRDRIAEFLARELRLELHPKKVTLKRWHEGIDFLGYVHFPFHSVLRTRTRRRMLKKLSVSAQEPKDDEEEARFERVRQSYLGSLKHCRGKKLGKQARNFRNVV